MANSDQAHSGQPTACASLLQNFVQRGWSIIPLRGTGENGKAPALPSWQRYQSHPPTTAQVAGWLADSRWTAYGIICGKVSGLVVLDFDEKSAYDHFCLTFPALTHTLTVRTGGRGGYHLYYRITYPVSSQKIIGGDLVAEGKYVVAPGSVINGKSWEIIHRPPTLRALTRDELKTIIAAFGVSTPQPAISAAQSISSIDFAVAYRNGVTASGERNNTLFRVACLMRNKGCTVHETITTLAKLHAQTPPQHGQRQEAPKQRYREAVATIHSVYTAPPVISDKTKTSHLSNRLREAILSLTGGTAFLRVYEGLLLQGITGTVSRQQIIDMLKGIVGRHSIDVALEMTDNTSRAFFAPLKSPAIADRQEKPEKSKHPKGKTIALLSGKNRIHIYQIPTPDDLCDYFQVVNSRGDAVTLDDLKSAKLYRMALHDAFIRRRPGQHSQTMLAARVGRKTRTIRTYGKALAHQIKPSVSRERIEFRSLGKLLYLAEGEGKPVWGRYLEDENGKRYKPYREIAARLLKTGRAVNLCTHGMSIYAAKNVDLDMLLRPAKILHPPSKLTRDQQTLIKPQPVLVGNGYTKFPEKCADLPATASAQPLIPKYANTLTNSRDEAAAYRLHTAFNQMPLSSARWIVEQCGRERALQLMHHIQKTGVKDARGYLVKVARNTTGTESSNHEQSARRKQKNQALENTARRLNKAISGISLVNARELVLTYGMEAVEATLRHVTYISNPQRRQPYEIRDLAGFFVAHIRQAWRRLNNAEDFSKPAPKFNPHQPRKRQPKYDPNKEFMRMARRGKQINWSYLEWRCQFWQKLGEPDPYFEKYSVWFSEAGRPLPTADFQF